MDPRVSVLSESLWINCPAVARRILLLITDLEIGGTPTVVRELAARLNSDAEVEVACLGTWGPVADQIVADGVKVTALGARRAADLHVIRDLVGLIRDRHFDTVFSFLIHANAAAAIASLFCGELRFIQSIQTTQPWPKWHWMLQKIVHHAAEKVVVPSRSAADAAHDWADVPREKIVVIPNAVSPAQSDRPSAARKRTRVGFIGRLDPVKRVTDLVSAMALLDPKFTLDIYGDGDERPRIQAEVARLGLSERVTLHGATRSPDAALRTFGLLVLPSEAEGFGLVLIEAMAAGVPVVATDVPGIRDVVADRVNGLLVPVGQPARLAGAIGEIANSPDLREQLTRAGKECALAHSWDSALAHYRTLLQLNPHIP